MNPTRDLLVIAGPTGVGKSALAVEVALAVGAEVVSADSRQLYRGLDIGTATPTEAERQGVPHHLLDVVDPDVRINAGRFGTWAREAVEGVWSRGRPSVVVGGSTLYVHALVEGLADLPPLDPDLERALTTEAATTAGRDRLFQELRQRDPAAAATLDPSKTQRLVRLLGVVRSTGKPVSGAWRAQGAAPFHTRLVVLDRPRPDLYRRIDARVDVMLADGLVDEARRVLEQWPDARGTLEATIGYRELLPTLREETTPDAVRALIQRNSRRYAKRQLTWYRRYPDALWLDAETTDATGLLKAVSPWPSL